MPNGLNVINLLRLWPNLDYCHFNAYRRSRTLNSSRPVLSPAAFATVMSQACRWLLVAIILASHVKAMKIAFHAQVGYKGSGIVVGSLVTTTGMARAFQSAGQNQGDEVKVFTPDDYSGLSSGDWDVLIVEGYFLMLKNVIHEARRWNPKLVVIFICLDPVLPGIPQLLRLDVDGVLTNSRAMVSKLQRTFPTRFMQLAADPDVFSPTATLPASFTQAEPISCHHRPVVFVGGAVSASRKPELFEMLREALPFGYAIHNLSQPLHCQILTT